MGWDIFKSREQKLFEKGIARGLPYDEARRRAAGALRCDFDRNGDDVFIATGDPVLAHRREHGVQVCEFEGIGRDVYLRTGDPVAAHRAEIAAKAFPR